MPGGASLGVLPAPVAAQDDGRLCLALPGRLIEGRSVTLFAWNRNFPSAAEKVVLGSSIAQEVEEIRFFPT